MSLTRVARGATGSLAGLYQNLNKCYAWARQRHVGLASLVLDRFEPSARS